MFSTSFKPLFGVLKDLNRFFFAALSMVFSFMAIFIGLHLLFHWSKFVSRQIIVFLSCHWNILHVFNSISHPLTTFSRITREQSKTLYLVIVFKFHPKWSEHCDYETSNSILSKLFNRTIFCTESFWWPGQTEILIKNQNTFTS